MSYERINFWVTHIVAGTVALVVSTALFKLSGDSAPFIACSFLLYAYNLQVLEKKDLDTAPNGENK